MTTSEISRTELNDLRRRVLAGKPLTAEEMHHVVESLRHSRLAAQKATKGKKKAPTESADEIMKKLNQDLEAGK